MAETTVKLPEFEDFVKKVQVWLENTAIASANPDGLRDWCLLGMEKSLTEENLKEFFTREELGKKFATEYKKATDAGPPFAFLQMESDLIYSMHKCFAARHRGRLMSYRDDCVQKNYRVHNALSLGGAKYARTKDDAERLVQWQQT